MNDNDKKILNILNRSKKYLTTEEISSLSDCSIRTVRNSINRIEEYLEEEKINYSLKKSYGNGILLEIYDYSHMNLKKIELYLKILKLDISSLKDLRETLFISYSQSHKILEELNLKLEPFNIEILIKENIGFEISDKNNLKEEFVKNLFKNSIDNNDEFISLLNYWYGKDKVIELRFIIESFLHRESLYYPELLKNKILIESLYYTNRKINKESQDLNSITSNEVDKTIATNLFKRINNIFLLRVDENDIESFGVLFNNKNIQEYYENDKIDKLIKSLVKHFILIGDEFLDSNVDLINKLKGHLKISLIRLKNGLNNINPLYEEIKRLSPYYFNEVFKVVDDFNKENNGLIPTSEIGFITIYLETFSKNSTKKAILITNYRTGAANYLCGILIDTFGWLDRIIILGVEEAKIKELNNYIIFSTEKLDFVDSIVISNDIAYEGLNLSYLDKRNSDELNSYTMLFEKELTYLDHNYNSKYEVIKFMVSELIKKEYVNSKFIDSVIERENKESTEIGNKIALIHGDPKYIKVSSISFMRLISDVNWEFGNVKYVFLIAVKPKEYQRYNLKRFFKAILKLEENLDNFDKVNQYLEFIDLLKF